MAIPREDVFKAAEALVEQGKKATARAVRETLGGGSPNEINAHLRAWRAQVQEREEEAKVLGEMPAEVRNTLAEPVEALLARLWATLKATTTTEVEAMRAKFETQAAARREEAQEQTDLAEELAAELEKSRQALETEQTQRASAEQATQAQREELARLTERLEQQARQLEELTRLREAWQTSQAEVADLKTQGVRMEADAEKAEQARQQAETQVQAQAEKLDKARQAYKKSQQTIQSLKLENAKLQERANNADRRSVELRAQVTALQERLALPTDSQAALAAGSSQGESGRRKRSPRTRKTDAGGTDDQESEQSPIARAEQRLGRPLSPQERAYAQFYAVPEDGGRS